MARERGQTQFVCAVDGRNLLTLAAMLSALSGIGRGIRWLSNINMALSWLLLVIFVVFGATAFAGEMFIAGLVAYLKGIPAMSVTVWNGGDTGDRAVTE
ncbi:MAG: hypothetical protein CM15mP74_31620 [Halieaceae bacterium]|nr:MAG: hypothetical protein CM15mP74_31620 [Halieaceae bacterium]